LDFYQKQEANYKPEFHGGYRTLEERIPPEHPLCKFRRVADGLLSTMDAELDALYVKTGRASIPPERLLRAILIQTLYFIRSERQLIQHIDYCPEGFMAVFLGMLGKPKPAISDPRGAWMNFAGATNYDVKSFVQAIREMKVTPHVA